jgi:hypothetical protein
VGVISSTVHREMYKTGIFYSNEFHFICLINYMVNCELREYKIIFYFLRYEVE